MPRLPSYTAQIGGARASAGIGNRAATAADTGGLVAAAAQDLGEQTVKSGNQIITFMEEEDQRKVLVSQAELRAKYAKRLDEAANTGEDLDKIREEFENDSAGIYDGLQTRKGRQVADYYTATSGQIFEAKANDIQVTRTVNQARVDGNKFISATYAVLATNPGYLPQAERDLEAFSDTVLKNVPPDKRAVLVQGWKQDLNVAAARANARTDPEGTLRAIEGGAYDLSPQQRESAIAFAESVKRVSETNRRLEEAERRQKRSDLDRDARMEYTKSILSGGGFNLQKALQDDRLMPGTLEHLDTYAKAYTRQLQTAEKASDPVVQEALWKAIHNPDPEARLYNTDAIFAYVANGQLSPRDADKLINDVSNMRDQNNVKLSSKLSAQIGIIDQQLARDLRYKLRPELMSAIKMNYRSRVEDRMNTLRADNKDPSEVFNRDSKLYVGTPEFIQSAIDDARQGPHGTRKGSNEPVPLPNGKWVQWNGKGDPGDPANYDEVAAPSTSGLVDKIPQ